MTGALTPDDLTPRQRVAVLYLWSGLTPKGAAGVMRVSIKTFRQWVGEVGERLPGNAEPQQKILLWKADHAAAILTAQLLAHQIIPNNIGLPKNTG